MLSSNDSLLVIYYFNTFSFDGVQMNENLDLELDNIDNRDIFVMLIFIS